MSQTEVGEHRVFGFGFEISARSGCVLQEPATGLVIDPPTGMEWTEIPLLLALERTNAHSHDGPIKADQSDRAPYEEHQDDQDFRGGT